LKHSLKFNHFYPRAAAVLLAALLFCAVAAASSGAAGYVVDSTADTAGPSACTGAPSDCTLRGAISAVNADVTPDTITFNAPITSLTIGTPLPAITNKLTINGGGVTVVGSGAYATNCLPSDYAFTTTGAEVERNNLPIFNVCGRPVATGLTPPTIQVGPRRADNTVSISGTGAAGTTEIYRSDSPAGPEEATSSLQSLISPTGAFSYTPLTQPTPSERFTATSTDGNGRTTGFATRASAPSDLTSPTLINAVATSNNSVRLDFTESIGQSATGALAAFGLTMGAANRQITSVNAYGNSVFVGSATTPWATGEAGTVNLTGNGRVTDTTGNEVLGTPTLKVYSGPGEINVPVASRYRANPLKFCQHKTKKCKRGQTYLYLNLNKASRVVFNVVRASNRAFVVRFVHKLPVGTSKMRLSGTVNGRTLPATNLIVQAVAEDAARNKSVPVDAPFKVVTRSAKL
jgi:CSLREA domain-containing protein